MIFSSTHNLSQPLFENLLYGFGSPNYGTQRSLCFNAMVVAHLMTYGLEEPGRDYANVKYIIYTGRNMVEAISTSETSSLMKAIAQRRACGGARSALYQDGQQGRGMAADQTRHRSGLPSGAAQRDRHRTSCTTPNLSRRTRSGLRNSPDRSASIRPNGRRRSPASTPGPSIASRANLRRRVEMRWRIRAGAPATSSTRSRPSARLRC